MNLQEAEEAFKILYADEWRFRSTLPCQIFDKKFPDWTIQDFVDAQSRIPDMVTEDLISLLEF